MSIPPRDSSHESPVQTTPAPAADGGRTDVFMAQELARLRQALKVAEDERAAAVAALDGFVEHAPVGLAVFDRDLICRRANAIWFETRCLTAEQAVGRHLYQILPGATQSADLHRRALAGETFDGETIVQLANGKRSHGPWRIRPWRDASGEIGGLLVMIYSITDIVEAREEAETASRAKTDFLANMSHEIRTPLNGVMGVAGALARTSLAPDQREMVKLIEGSAQTLERLLSDILDLSAIEADRFELKAEPFDLGELIQSVSALFEPRAHEKAIAFERRVDPAAAGRYTGDVVRLKQVLANLLSNAVKFTDRGAVRLIVDTAPGGEPGRQRLNFRVRDSGIGFDAETKARLFQRFEQADGSISRRYGGTGLGLAISRSLALRMGGGVEARSELGMGSEFTFSVELPRAEGPASQVQTPPDVFAVAVGADQATGRPLKVLLAEDHPTNRKVVELILGAAGVHLVSVENGAEALQASTVEAFDLILMDVQMPVMDGLTAIRAIRSRERVEGRGRIPIVALTANAMPEHARASRAAGADDHVTKPVSAQTLLDVVNRAATGDYAAAAIAASA